MERGSDAHTSRNAVDRLGPSVLRWVLVWVVSVSGPLAAVWSNGEANQRGGRVLALLAIVWVLIWTRRPLSSVGGLVLLVGGLGVGLLVTPAIGRTPVVVAFASVGVATSALVAWSPLPRWPARAHQTVPLALVPLFAAQVLWARSQPLPASIALLLLALVVVEVHHRWPRLVEPVDVGLRQVARALRLDRLASVTATALRLAVAQLRRPRTRREWSFALALAVAFAVRLAWVTAMTRSDVGVPAFIGDWYSTWNLRIADQISHGHTPSIDGRATAYWPVGYGATLAPLAWIGRVTGLISTNYLASLLNVVLGTATVGFAGGLAARWVTPVARNRTAWILAFAPTQIMAASVVVAEPITTFLLVAVVYAATVVAQGRRGSARHLPLVSLGLLIGYAMLVSDRSAVLVVVPALAIRSVQGSWTGALRATACTLLGAVLVLAPWAVRNGVEVGWWSPTATIIPEGMCASTYDHDAFTYTHTYDDALLDVSDDCIRYSPLDDPELGLASIMPPSWPFVEPREAAYARRNTATALSWMVTHPGDIAARAPEKLRSTAGDDANGGLDIAEHFGRQELVGRSDRGRLLALSNGWYWTVAAATAIGLAMMGRLRRAAPLWVVPLVLLVQPLLGPYGFSRHFFSAQPFLAIMAGAVFAALAASPLTDRAAAVDAPTEGELGAVPVP